MEAFAVLAIIYAVAVYLVVVMFGPVLVPTVIAFAVRNRLVKVFAILLALAGSYYGGSAAAAYELATGYWAPTWLDPDWKNDCRRNGHPCPCAFCGGGAPG